MINIKDVAVSYMGKKVLDKINIDIRQGEFLLICGMSGSGKTTITKLINGLIPHYDECDIKGNIIVDGIEILKSELYEISRVVSSVFQNPKTHFFNVNTTMELLFFLENIGTSKEMMDSRLDELLELFPIEHLLNRSIFDLSGGEKQILSIAATYIAGSRVLVLDEPSSNLDDIYTDIISNMLDVLKKKNITIIVSEHRLYYLKDLVDRVIYINNGAITKEFTKDEFLQLGDIDRKTLGLRTIEKEFLKDMNISKVFFHDVKEQTFRINSLYVDFKGSNRAIDFKNIEFPMGKIIGVVGRNGIGKSTFIKSIIGVKAKTKFDIEIEGKRFNKKDLIKNSNLVMQDVNHQLFSDTVLGEITLGMKETNIDKVDSVINALNLTEYKELHPMSLSGGQKQRVAIASVILNEGKIICFDEPTSGMDFENMMRISKIIKSLVKKDKIIFIISHDTEFLNRTVDIIINIEDYSISYG